MTKNFPDNVPKRTLSFTPPPPLRALSSFPLPIPFFLIILAGLSTASCGSSGGMAGSTKAITAFSLAGVNGTISGTTIYVKNIPLYTDDTKTAVTNLINIAPVIAHNGVSVSPASGSKQDFRDLTKTYTVTAEDLSTTVYTVIVSLEPLTDTNDIGTYIDKADDIYDGGATAKPIPLPVKIELSGDWSTLLTAINTADKFVAMDLSACTDVTAFDPNAADTDPGRVAAKGRIVSLVLPDGATGVIDGTFYNPTFEYFTALERAAGAGITTVGRAAFTNCTALETVNLPAATDVRESVFSDCTALKTVNLPTVTSIGESAFSFCNALASVNLPKAASIGNSAFLGCISLETLSLPEAQTIDSGAFSHCYSLETVSLPAATDIRDSVFSGCTALKTVNLPKVTSIWETFSGCTALETVSLPKATSIDLRAFYNCTALKTVSLPEATIIGQSAFQDCNSLKVVILPETQTIGLNAFSGCTALKTVSLPKATDIGDSAFKSCATLKTLSLPEAQTIGLDAFGNCSSLKTLSLPKATGIGAAFRNCTALETLSIPAAQSIGAGAFHRTGGKTLTITLPNAAPSVADTGYGCDITFIKTVTVKTPAERTDYDTAWQDNFKKAFGVSGGSNTVTINLTITDL